jgi:hypothetical protein
MIEFLQPTTGIDGDEPTVAAAETGGEVSWTKQLINQK